MVMHVGTVECMNTAEAAATFLETDAPLKELAARHDEAVVVLKRWFHEHPDKLRYRGVGYSRQGPWRGLDIALATKTLGDNLADCQVDRYREILIPLKAG